MEGVVEEALYLALAFVDVNEVAFALDIAFNCSWLTGTLMMLYFYRRIYIEVR